MDKERSGVQYHMSDLRKRSISFFPCFFFATGSPLLRGEPVAKEKLFSSSLVFSLHRCGPTLIRTMSMISKKKQNYVQGKEKSPVARWAEANEGIHSSSQPKVVLSALLSAVL